MTPFLWLEPEPEQPHVNDIHHLVDIDTTGFMSTKYFTKDIVVSSNQKPTPPRASLGQKDRKAMFILEFTFARFSNVYS